MTGRKGQDIVVGIDPARDWYLPLAWAADEAHRRRLPLRLVLAVAPQHDTHHVDDTPGHMALFMPNDEEVALRAQRALLSEATAGLSDKYPDVHVTHEAMTGHPVEELARAAEHALALVLGRRGRGGYTGMRLGSVVHGLLHRAYCPVITVPSE